MVDLTPLFQAIASLAVALITAFVIPFIKKHMSAVQQQELAKWAEVAVKAAEQLFSGAERGEEKREYVTNFLASKGFKVDQSEVINTIESAVHCIQGTKQAE